MNIKKIFQRFESDYKEVLAEVIEYEFDGKGLCSLISFLRNGINDNGAIDELVSARVDMHYYDLRPWEEDNREYIGAALDDPVTCIEHETIVQNGQKLMYLEKINKCLEEMVGHIKHSYRV